MKIDSENHENFFMPLDFSLKKTVRSNFPKTKNLIGNPKKSVGKKQMCTISLANGL